MNPLSIACPKCGAGVDERCRTTSGTNRVTDAHVDREWLAADAAYARRIEKTKARRAAASERTESKDGGLAESLAAALTRAETAEAERDAAREALARVEALADEWEREQALRDEIGVRYARTGRLHEALAQSDMTPSALAETVGMPLASLHNLLYLRRLPSTTEVVAFAEVLGVDPNWLHAGDAARIARGGAR
jgi:hypothetical protein